MKRWLILCGIFLLPVLAFAGTIQLKDEGFGVGTVDSIDCVGAGVTCTVGGGAGGTLTVSTAGTITSLSAGTGITLTPNPIIATGTIALTTPVALANGGTGVDLSATGGSNQVIQQAGAGAVFTVGQLNHNQLSGLTTNDDHTQYALLAGRSGGQTLRGGTLASNNLTLSSTAHATKGNIVFGNSVYDEVNDTLILGSTTPTSVSLDVFGHVKTGVTFQLSNAQFYGGIYTLASGVALGEWYENLFWPPTINGIAGGPAEAVTDAATLQVVGPPTGSNITFDNGPYSLFIESGLSRFNGNVSITSGALVLSEITTPSNPAVGYAILYLHDNSGRTELRIRYSDGNDHQLDIEDP